MTGGTTDKNVIISWMDGNPDNFAPVKSVTINGVPYIKGEIIYTINTGKYHIICEDFAGNAWQTEFNATTKNIKTETLQQEYFESADNDGNIFAFATSSNALEFLTEQEKKFIRTGTWNSGVWDTGIMMDEVDSVNAVNGNYYIFKSEFDAKVEVAYFTEKRLNEVVNLYAKARIKSYFYFEKNPAKSYEGNDLFAYKNGYALLARSVEFENGISVSIDGTPLIGQFYAEIGEHLITVADLYGNLCDYTATIVRSAPTINYSVEEGKTNTVSFDREYKLSSKVTLTITDELDEMAMYYVIDSSGKSLGYFYRNEVYTLEKSGKYIVRTVNHFGQSQEFVLYISLEKPSINLAAITSTKKLEITINASGDRYAKLQSLSILKSVDNGTTWNLLGFDDYGKAIKLDSLNYNFKTSGLYKVSVTDEFRTGIDTVVGSLNYIQPKPSGTLKGVVNGGFTNGTVSFECSDEAKLTLKKNGEVIAYWAGQKISEDGFYELTFENSDGYIEVFAFTIDTVLPEVVLSGANNNGITNTDVSLAWNEENLTAQLYFNDELVGEYVSGTALANSGKYTLIITDKAGNSVTINFTIDKQVSFITNLYNGGAVNSAYFTANEHLEILLTFNGEIIEYAFGDKLTAFGKYSVTLTDGLGNIAKISFTIIEPIVKTFFFNFDEVSNLKKILVNGEETRLNYGDLVLTQSGEYTVEVVLESGTYSFTVIVDVTPPQLSLGGVENGGATKGSVTLTDLTENASIKAYLNGIEFEYQLGNELSDVGTYRFVITDIVGNETELTFEILFSMNGGAVALTLIAILGSIGITITIVLLRKRGKFSKKSKPKSEPDEG